MKKIKALLYSAAFVIALSASFAFKPAPDKWNNAYVTITTSCDTPVTCNGGEATCIQLNKVAFATQSSCSG
ncbi:MAG TPA: DUF6520 family protein, partial [Puia sp.]|nr:DUF6520 family protein [Puia sp.]